MSKTVDTFISLLRSAVIQTNEEIDLADINYETLFSISKFHDLAHIVYYELNRRNALPKDEILAKFKQQYNMAILRHVKRMMAIEQIREILEKARIPFVLLKGAVLIDLYPRSRNPTGWRHGRTTRQISTRCCQSSASARLKT